MTAFHSAHKSLSKVKNKYEVCSILSLSLSKSCKIIIKLKISPNLSLIFFVEFDFGKNSYLKNSESLESFKPVT